MEETKQLYPIRCTCNRLLGKFNGSAETKCPKCKTIVSLQVSDDHKEVKTQNEQNSSAESNS